MPAGRDSVTTLLAPVQRHSTRWLSNRVTPLSPRKVAGTEAAPAPTTAVATVVMFAFCVTRFRYTFLLVFSPGSFSYCQYSYFYPS